MLIRLLDKCGRATVSHQGDRRDIPRRARARSLDIAELADTLSPDWCRHKGLALLRAYFDESGVHAGSPATIIAGFIGSRAQWRSAAKKWKPIVGDLVFHYKDMRKEERLISELADLLSESGLGVVAAGFSGDWSRAIAHGSDWSRRFPSCYHMIFEHCFWQMDRYSKEHWNGEPIAVMFSRQDEYAKRAEEVWRAYKGNELWKNIVSFSYGDPELSPLQAADMIAYETFQCIGADSPEVWDNWPLVRRLLARRDPKMFGSLYDEGAFVAMMKRGDADRQYLRAVDAPTKG